MPEGSLPTLLSGLTPQQREFALQQAEHRHFRADQVIVNAGKPATRLFLLKKGSAKLYRVTKKGDEAVLWYLAAEDILGVGALLEKPTNYMGTAKALDACEMLVWSHGSLRSLPVIHDRMIANALRIALNTLATYTDRIVGLTTETAEQRLARTLLDLARRTGEVRPTGVDITITNENLGGLANVSAFTASRLTKKWERQGAIEKRRGKIRIFSPENLLNE